MDADKTQKVDFPPRSSILEDGDPTLHRQIALPLPPSYLQGRCVSHMDDDPFFHLFPSLSRSASLNSWPWHGSGTGTTGVPWHGSGTGTTGAVFFDIIGAFGGPGLDTGWCSWQLIFLVKNNNNIFLNNSFHFICFANDPIPSVASLDWSDTVKMELYFSFFR